MIKLTKREIRAVCVSGVIVTLMACGAGIVAGKDQVEKPASGVTPLQVTEAKLIKLQLEFLELQKQMASCQQTVVASSAQRHESSILQSIGAKPGQKFDWTTMTVTPVQAPVTKK